jgi:hypothetical protein
VVLDKLAHCCGVLVEWKDKCRLYGFPSLSSLFSLV